MFEVDKKEGNHKELNSFSITHSTCRTDSKPQGGQVAKYQKASNYVLESVSVEQFAALAANGYTWRAGIYKDGATSFKKSNALASQIIALDFDGIDSTPYEVAEYAANIGLAANVVYPTFSQNPDTWEEAKKQAEIYTPRLDDFKYIYSRQGPMYKNEYKNGYNFRLVWCLSEQVEVREYEQAAKVLLEIFNKYNPDKATKDVSRLWFGSAIGAIVLNEQTTDVKQFRASLGQHTVAAKIADGKTACRALSAKGGFTQDYAELPEQDVVAVEGNWWEGLRRKCPLWDKYEKGKYLDYNERLVLFSNLKYLRRSDSAKSIVGDIEQFYKDEVWQGHTFNAEQLRRLMSSSSLKAKPIVKYQGELITVPEYFKIPQRDRAVITPKEKEGLITLAELDRWLDENVAAVLDSPGCQYLNSQTGSGKTERIIRYIDSAMPWKKRKIIYAVPHFKGGEEFYERFRAVSDKEIHLLPQQRLTARDILLLQMGLPKETKCQERADFITSMMDAEDGLWVITHSLLVNLPDIEADLIVVDENIEDSMIRTSVLTMPQLSSLMPFLPVEDRTEYVQWLAEVEEMDRGQDVELGFLRNKVAPVLRKRIEDYLSGEVPLSDIPQGFFACEEHEGRTSVQKGMPAIRITQQSPLMVRAMAKRIPVKLFSATPLSARIKNYYGLEIEILKAPVARGAGKIIQYRGMSGAKGKVVDGQPENLKELAAYIKSSLPEEEIAHSLLISFKGTEGFWKGEGFNLAELEDGTAIHFKNNCGLDYLKGRSLIVVGKYDINPECYLGTWDDIGDGTTPRLQNTTVELNGVKQTLYLWDKEELKAEQLERLEEAAEQTAGRARTLREAGATVYLFSNFTIRGVDEVRD